MKTPPRALIDKNDMTVIETYLPDPRNPRGSIELLWLPGHISKTKLVEKIKEQFGYDEDEFWEDSSDVLYEYALIRPLEEEPDLYDVDPETPDCIPITCVYFGDDEKMRFPL